MKPPPFDYHAPATVAEVLALLAEHGDEAKVLAGGQSLVPLMSLRLARPSQLVDINKVEGLDGVADTAGLRLGALVRHRTAERSTANPLMAGAARFIGHAAIRNRGTVAGSLAHGDPAAELPAVLLALDGEVEATSKRGTRRIAAADLYLGFLMTTIEPDELLTSVQLPAWRAGTGWSFQQFSRRSGDFGVASVAVALRIDGNAIADVRIALAGMSDRAVRASKAESALAGQAPSAEAWAAAAADGVADLDPPSDLHGTAAYRRHLAGVLIKRALTEAHKRTQQAA